MTSSNLSLSTSLYLNYHATPASCKSHPFRNPNPLTNTRRPQTPAPSRFLLAKRQGSAQQPHQSQKQTPNQPQQQASAPHQFRATPRFSSASTPRPSSTTNQTTLAARHTAPRSRPTRDVAIDSSPIPDSPNNNGNSPYVSPTGGGQLPEPIEFDSSYFAQSPSHGGRGGGEVRVYDDDDDGDFGDGGRSTKRRRISITSSDADVDGEFVAGSSQAHAGVDDGGEEEERDVVHTSSFPYDALEEVEGGVDGDGDQIFHSQSDDMDMQGEAGDGVILSPSSGPGSAATSSSEDDERTYDAESGLYNRDATAKQPKLRQKPAVANPIFFHPPRFKTSEQNDLQDPPQDHLPEIFSPQRRRRGRGGDGVSGGKYVSGGLAAELRDWLVDVKEETDKRPATATVQLAVEDVRRGGQGITLVTGRPVTAASSSGQGLGVRAILAGVGGIEDGLGGGGGGSASVIRKRNRVLPGSVVAIAPPAWDVELDGRWAVAYRWEVVGSKG
ncbi:hypothetical protein B0T17DRAFT_503372 [Bombardia bombarda]|uniref:Uncharacterized protein n=1 Tax=Bombardia bombarda TaxID=252184 RepID=A0AA40CFT1_9PEZI|nr:hypothetical protein B0T17DRAFT_503372 [Bombardia bombarda]